MLQLSNDQWGALADAKRRQFAEEMADRAERRHPAACRKCSREELIAALEREIQTAHGHGLRNRGLLARFTDLSMVLGAGFAEREDWAQAILANTRLTPPQRLAELEEAAVFVVKGQGA